MTEIGLRPNIVVNTGAIPHRRAHLYFRLTPHATDVADLQAVNAALADRLGTDAVHDPIRILRLAGTINFPPPKKGERGYVVELTTLVVHGAKAAGASKLLALCGPTTARNGAKGTGRNGKGTGETGASRTPDEIIALLEASLARRAMAQHHVARDRLDDRQEMVRRGDQGRVPSLLSQRLRRFGS